MQKPLTNEEYDKNMEEQLKATRKLNKEIAFRYPAWQKENDIFVVKLPAIKYVEIDTWERFRNDNKKN